MTAAASVVSLRGIEKVFETTEAATTALSGIDLEITAANS
jgi:hypothetical protein